MTYTRMLEAFSPNYKYLTETRTSEGITIEAIEEARNRLMNNVAEDSMRYIVASRRWGKRNQLVIDQAIKESMAKEAEIIDQSILESMSNEALINLRHKIKDELRKRGEI